jgi:VCBS repeat-containing protein
MITPAGNLTDSGTIAFTDVDLTDVHLVSLTGTYVGPGTALGTLTAVKNTDTTGTGLNGQLTWTYTVGAAAVEYLAKDQTRVESFTITINDQNGSIITKQIDVTITGTNDAPIVAAVDVTGAVTELVTPVGDLTDSGTIAFTDVDLIDVHSISTITPSAGALGTLTASVSTDTTGSGLGGVVTWNYSVSASAVEYLAAGEHKFETFSFNVLDNNGGSVLRTVTIDIIGTGDDIDGPNGVHFSLATGRGPHRATAAT